MNLFRSGFERANWTILGACIGTLSAVLLGIYTNIETVVSITAGVCVTIVFMQVGEIAHRDKIGEILGTYYRVRENPALKVYVEQLIEKYLSIETLDDSDFTKNANGMLESLLDELSVLADGQLHIGVYEELLVAIEHLARCKHELRVSSWQDKIEYWESTEGKNYNNAQIELIKSGKKITRVFILNGNELPLYKDVLSEQSQAGIEVRIADEEEIPSDLLEAYILYDDAMVRTERLLRGFHKTVTLIIDKDEVDRYERKFRELYLRSKPLTDVII